MVVFFDIDGTLVDDKSQTIPASAVKAVEELGRKGHIAVVNTGRPYSHIDPRVRAMAFGGWVCGCGMEIRLGENWISRREPEQSLCDYVVEWVRKCGMMALYEANDGSIVIDGAHSVHPVIQREAKQMTEKGFAVYALAEHPKFMKLVVFDGPGCDRAAFLQAMEPFFTCIDRGNTMIELVLKGCSKAEGMALMLEALGETKENAMAIGDSTNDLPMFSLAAHKVCMGNGMEELKAQAEYVTASVMEDGIEKALKHYGLIG